MRAAITVSCTFAVEDCVTENPGVLRKELDPHSINTSEMLLLLQSTCLAFTGETTKGSGVVEERGMHVEEGVGVDG